MDMRTATVMTMGFNAQEAGEILAVADQNDPLRLALRKPSPLLVENIQVRILDTNRVAYGPTRDDIRDVLAAFLAEAVTPDGN
jgi:hypothetical protein